MHVIYLLDLPFSQLSVRLFISPFQPHQIANSQNLQQNNHDIEVDFNAIKIEISYSD